MNRKKTSKSREQLQWVRLPLQRRSQKSLQRILDATEKIMESKSFAEISVSEIVKKARSSTGVFYSRFHDKLALLHHLDERFTAEAEETIKQNLVYQNWKNHSFEEVSAGIIGLLYRIHQEKRGLLKSIILQVRVKPDQRFQETGKRLSQLINRIAAFLLNWQDEITHSQPERMLRVALVMVIATIREVILFSETTMFHHLLDLPREDFPALLCQTFLQIVAGMKPTFSQHEQSRVW